MVTPGDSWDFFHSKIFEPTSPKFFTNQSLEGIFQRAIGGPWRDRCGSSPSIVVLVYGLRAAVGASRGGDELRAVAITGLVSVLVSPISWIHHLVWIVPALAVVIGAGRDRRRVAIAFFVAALFVARLPYFGHDEVKTGLLAALAEGLLRLRLHRAARLPRPRGRHADARARRRVAASFATGSMR